MSNVHARGQPLAGAASSEDHSRQIVARAASRRIKYHFIAAPLDENGPGGLAGDGIVTDSPSNLNGLPYAITAAGDIARVLHATVRGKTYAILGKLFETVEVSVPDDVDAVDIFLCNDAYEARRKSPLFQVTPNGTGLTHVYIHELPQVRLRRLQANAATAIAYPGTSQGQTTKRPDDTHIGYLTGDVWKELAYAYSIADVSRLCSGSTLARQYAADRGRGVITPEAGPPTIPATVFGLPRPDGPGPRLGEPAQRSAPVRQGDLETLSVEDWSEVLAPIYEGHIMGRVGTRYSDFGCYIDLPVVNIRLRYKQGAFSNAIGAADFVDIGDVLIAQTLPRDL